MTRTLAVLIILATALAALAAHARDFERLPARDVEELYVTTEDGVREKLIHLKNPGKPILLMEPGLGAQGLSLELTATALRLRGDYDIFIGNWRGSAKIPENEGPSLSASGRNGLEEVIRKDFPAHFRFVLNEYASPAQKAEGLRLFGHSMGGMMIMGALSDPRLSAELKPFIKGIVLFQSPHHVNYLQGYMKAFARVGQPAAAAARALGLRAIDMHTRLLSRSQRAKDAGGFKGRLLMPAVENFAIALTKLALSPAHTGREQVRRAFFKMGADKIPVDLLEDFARAVLNDGIFLDSRGERLIRPERITDLPVQVVRTKLDTLAPWDEQGEYFNELGTARKQLLSVHEMNHVDSVLFTRPEVDFLEHVLGFLRDPATAVAQARTLVFEPRCESILTKLRYKLRLRGV
ncbi:MAG: hypothetical protein HY075_06160 [Deltaproteobacteria bacterium]|nr:hypothetical protein [Deltaproteobacteria bacterium]